MKTLIVSLGPYQARGMDAWHDHGAGMTYAAAKNAGCDVTFLDMKALRSDEELKLRLRGYDLVGFGLKSSYYNIGMRVIAAAKAAGAKVIVGGYHATAAPQELIENPNVDWIFHGESEITFPKFLQSPSAYEREIWGEKTADLDDLPIMDRSIFANSIEGCSGWWHGGRKRMISVISARGCPYRCLSGDTIIHTIEGDRAISELVGKTGIRVLSRDPITQEPVYTPAASIFKTEENAEIVRVNFDDGTHIDCTPDHRFMVFKPKNQYIEESEWEVEAKDLKPKQRIRAVRFEQQSTGRVVVSTRRDICVYRAKLVLESVIGRKLESDERVHHKDRNPSNDSPDNLALTTKRRHVTDCHPEISRRMRLDNPAKNMTQAWRANIGLAVTGLRRSLESRLRYRESKLGKNNPQYKDSPLRRRRYQSRIAEIGGAEVNHKVVSVERLTERQDVFCMEVPETHWFYANKVLVHNCSFCQPIEDNHFGKLRRKSVDALIAELREVKERYNPECLMIHDDTFLLNWKWIEEFIEKYPEIGLPFWAAGRADGIVKYADLMPRLVQIGWELVSVGFESGSQRILDKISKGTTIAENLEAAKIIRAAGGKIYANYILGFPFETKEDIQATAKMADAINAEMPSWAFFTPYPGCESGEECIRNGWSLLDRNHYDRCPSGRKVKFVDYDYLNRVLQGFRETPDKLLCDIVIPSYENEDLTIKCLQAIGRSTRENSYRVIWVDNGSKNTRRAEAEIQKLPHLYILNKTNQGFVGAINTGLRVSTAPFVCLLNNDTEVTPGWLDKLLAILCANPEIGIIGPLTGYAEVGPDSHHSLMLHDKLLPPDASTWGVQRCNEELEKAYPGRTYNTDFVAFLCAVIRRDVISRVGLLDTNYDMGMWDDLDYNLDTRKLGYKTVLALDTCIYHRGRSTFNLIEKKEKFNVNALLKKNRVYLDSKWNPEEITRLTKS
jgi:radical SAM superfamily enzyme YgiQ (UPF0313 family)